MSELQLKTPVAFLVFNRPDKTEKVFEAIRQAKPPKLLVVADGPRADRPGEAEKCAAVRAIIDRVDWDCQVLKNYAESNLGCKQRVASGLDWVFDTVEEAIILEDDCVPHPTFFRFCEELLNRYRHDKRIMSICGQNVPFRNRRTEDSYHFSRYSSSWGWASWRRAWRFYDVDMKLWPEVRDGNFLSDILGDLKTVKYWTRTFHMCYEGQINTWDYQWTFAGWVQNGMSILPSVNLVTNIGFDEEGTHTTDCNPTSSPANRPLEAMSFPLRHPPFVIRDAQADRWIQINIHLDAPLLERAKNKLRKVLGV